MKPSEVLPRWLERFAYKMTFLLVTGRTSRRLNLLFEARIREKSLSLFKLANLVESASALVTLVFCDESSVSILFSFCLF